MGALATHHDVPGADHGYDIRADIDDAARARETYALIARHVREATG